MSRPKGVWWPHGSPRWRPSRSPGNWDDVLRRAAEPRPEGWDDVLHPAGAEHPSRRWTFPRWRIVAVAAVILVGGLLVTRRSASVVASWV